MKKILFICLIILVAFNSEAQRKKSVVKWFSLGIKGGGGNSVLFNSDISSDKNVKMNYMTPSYFFGGRLTFTYGDVLGFGAEFNSSHFGQEYNIKAGNEAYGKKLNMVSNDLMVFMRLSGESGAYFEIGPKFSTLKSVSVKNTITGNFRIDDNLKTVYSPKYTGLMLGAGLSLMRTERVSLHFGLRGSYVFADIIPDHNLAYSYILDDGVYHPANTVSNAKTNPFSVQAVLEFEYFFAFFGDASCGKGRLMFFQ